MTCNKKAYTSWRHANNDAKAMRRRHEVRERPYWCRHCCAFHVGMNSQRLWTDKRKTRIEAVEGAAE